MKKYLFTCAITFIAPSAFATLGSGLYLSAGVGGGWLNYDKLEYFHLDYPNVRFNNGDLVIRDKVVEDNFNDSAEYAEQNKGVVAGRAAIGYLWDVFEGEPTHIGGSIYTINATLGLEFGYRIFDKINSEHSETEQDSNFSEIPPFDVVETATSKTFNQAFDLMAVARLPFTENNKFALLLKGGVAYNIYEVESNLTITADLSEEPVPGYNRDLNFDTEKYDEFLPVLGAGLEYMFYTHFGISAEYSAIMDLAIMRTVNY